MEAMEYFGRQPTTQLIQETRQQFDITETKSVFSFVYTVGSIDIYVNGDHLPMSAYIANNGTTVTLATPVNAGSIVVMVSKTQLVVANVYTKPEVNALFVTKNESANLIQHGFIYFMGSF